MSVVLTLGITHAVEQQHIQLPILGSPDGKNWSLRPLAIFPPKCYCGNISSHSAPAALPVSESRVARGALGAAMSGSRFPLLSVRRRGAHPRGERLQRRLIY